MMLQICISSVSSNFWKSVVCYCYDCRRHSDSRGLFRETRQPQGNQGRTITIRCLAGNRGSRRVAEPGRREAIASKGKHPQGRTRRVQHQGKRLSVDCNCELSGECSGDPLLWNTCGIRPDRCGDHLMDATLIVIDSDAELA